METLIKKLIKENIHLSVKGSDLEIHFNGDVLPTDLIQELKKNKQELIDYIQTKEFKKADEGTVIQNYRDEYRESGKPVPLSFAQERMWFVDQLAGTLPYHNPSAYSVFGNIYPPLFEQAFRALIERHEVLHTVVEAVDGHPQQVMFPVEEWTMNYYDDIEFENDDEIKAFIEKEIQRPFDLSKDSPLRVSLIKTEPKHHVMLLVNHHIATDDWSNEIMMQEFQVFFNALSQGITAQLPKLPIQYADFAIWQRLEFGDDGLVKQQNFWKEHLNEAPDFEFPTDFPRPVHKSSRGARGDTQTTPELAQQLNQLGKQEGVTTFMLMLAAFKTLFYKYTQQDDICLGAPIAGRTIKEVEPLIGFFVNTLPMRSQIDPQENFRSFLQKIKKTTLNAYANQQVPFEQIVEVVGANRALDRDPLFQITLTSLGPQGVGDEAAEAAPGATPGDIPEGAVQIVPYSNDLNLLAQRDMSLYFVEKAGRYLLGTFYCADLYEQSTIDRMLEHFLNLLEAIVDNPDEKIAELNIMSGKEKKQLLLEFNKTNAAYPQEQSIADLFEAQVQKTPDHTALVVGQKSWTYQELNQEAEVLAKHLQKQYKVSPGDFVGLMLPRSEWMIISILGILKSGAAYVPIDPTLPGERKNFIIEDTELKLLVILSENLFDMNLMEVDSLAIDIQLDMIKEEEDATPLNRQSGPTDPAYVMYTSGTTGKPKGIVVNQLNVIKLSKEEKEIAVFESDRVLQWSNYAFDGSVYEIFSTFLNGASLHMIAQQDASDPNRLAKVLQEQNISILFITTALFNAFVDVELQAFSGLRKVLFGGELVSPPHVKKALAELGPDKIIHVYGPTETTVYATYYPVREAKDINVPIGRPLSNTKIYLVNEAGDLAGIGVQGEIWIGGDGVAQYYLNRPELTKEKFIDNPFTHAKGARIYKTGDLAKMLPDGNIDFIGRKDSQIKMRGYRIELGEIESVLQQLDTVQQAVVLAKKDPTGTKQLVAYIVPDGEFDKAQIQSDLKTHIPEYMVPAIMMDIDKMPLTPNGKIDKKALPEPDSSSIVSKEYVAPQSETEEKIVEVWQELLELDKIGINDDFFELGGHSLLATRVISELRTQLNVEVAIRDMFAHTNVKDLAAFIDQQAPQSDLPKIEVQPRPEQIPLSYAQERLWFVDRLQGSVQYHIPMILKVSGDIDLNNFEQGFKAVIDRHELLRTVIREENGTSYQKIMDSNKWKMDLIQDPKYYDRKELDPLINELVGRPFNLSEEFPFRLHMIQLNDNEEYVFIANLHHIATDGWSNSILVDEFVKYYMGLQDGKDVELPPLPIQYADYAIWERTTHDKTALERQLDYWVDQLTGVNQLDLPTDYPRPPMQSFRGGTEATILSKELSDQIFEFANKHDVTPFMVFLAAFKNLLYKYSGQEDICIGSPIAGRTIKEVESLIGFFVNTLTLRSQVDPEMSFLDLLSTVKTTLLDAYANQLVPFEQIVERLGVERDLSRTPLFGISLSYQNTPDTKEKSLGNIRIEALDSEVDTTTQRDLSVFIEESPNGFIIAINYCIDLYKGSTIAQMMEHFSMLLSAIVNNPEEKIGHLRITTPEERNQLLLGFNDNALDYPDDQSIIDLFEEQVAKTPDHTALVFKGESWTYREIDRKANILAQLLREEFELGQGDFVGIMMPRSEWMIISLLAILKTEAAYVPIDLSHPGERKAFVAEDTQLKALILLSENIFDVSTLDVPGLAVDIQFDEFEEQFPDEAPERKGGSQHPAYVMYTSGTTGKPKGIVVKQQNVIKLAKESNAITVHESDRVLQWSNFAFDGSVYEIFSSLLNGASLHLIPGQDAADPTQLAKHIKEQELKVAFITTALFNAFVDYDVNSLVTLRKLLFGGELVSTQHVKKALEVLGTEKVIHVYGPTETTVYASYYPIETCEGNTVPIGKALSNTQIYIVDENGEPAGIGVVGEIWIGGDGVASGYLNRPDLTDEKFIDNPFGHHTGRIYRTGDLARFLPDGNIEFIGRRDSQIKMRGYRIELGEIEAALNQNASIKQAHVIAQKDPTGTKQLVAYIVPEGEFNADSIQGALKTKLPEYMVPAIMVELEALPLTANGKVDKKALPAPDIANMSQKEFVAPRNETEAAIANIWKELLELEEEVGIHHDFFELGGHSLLATRVISEIRDQFNVELAIKDLFQATTVAQLAQLVEEKEKEVLLPKLVRQERPERIPLSYAQERLWFVDQIEGSLHYHIPNVFKLQGDFNQAAFENAFGTVVNRHELLRTVIKEHEGVAYQEILPKDQWSMELDLDNDDLDKDQVTARVDKIIARPFDLAKDHPLRVGVIKVNAKEHVMVMVMHHIASDGWSSGIFLDEFNTLYNAFEKGEELILDPLPIQYADFAIWQRKYHDGAVLEQQLEYWHKQLQNNVPLEIPTDFPRPATQSFRGANSGIFINRELMTRLNDLANQKDVTPFMLLLAAFKVLLYRYGGQGDISVGSPIAGRTMKEVESLIGFFVNTLVIRSQVEAETPFDEYLNTIRKTTLDAYANQMAPYEKIVESLDVERDPSRTPVFQVMFAYQNTPPGEQDQESNLKISPSDNVSVNFAQNDLNITISEMPQGLIIGAHYCADLFLASTMDQMMLHYQQLLQSIVEHPTQMIGKLNIVSEKEQEKLLGFNYLTIDYPKERTIVELFKEQVQLNPDQVAVVYEEESWTYQQVDRASDELAMRLRKEFNIVEGDIVGLLVQRSPWMIIGMMGIIKAGGAYTPISLDQPLERKQFVIEDTKAKVLLTTTFAEEHCKELEVTTWVMDQEGVEAIASVELPSISSQTPAYVIYTSGTTGQPKGTLVNHQSLINLVKNNEEHAYQNTNRVLQWPSFTFDISVFNIFNTILHGASLYLIPERDYKDTALVSRFIQEHKIDTTCIGVAFLNALVDYDVNALKGITHWRMGGEKASFSHVRKLVQVLEPGALINEYGPTETTIIASCFTVETPDFDRLPIGKPVANVKVYIVNSFAQLAGVGVIGEIWIGGDAVSLGYLNRPELTAEKFIADPFSTEADALVYKTGDLARYLPDGNIEFIGRIDSQVKVRGYRIELSEIQHALQEHASIHQAVVLTKKDHSDVNQIIAYVVVEGTFNKEATQLFLQSKLPLYMLPAAYVLIDEVPLTINGKVNMALLPEPDFVSLNETEYVEARNELEQQIVDIWLELLKVEQVGVHDNFFDLGGHSLLATRAIAQIKSLKAVEIHVRDLFQYPTVAMLADFVDRQQELQQIPELAPQEREAIIPLSFAQERLWFVHQLGGSQQYHTPNILTLRGDINPASLQEAFKVVVQRHEVLRTLIREQNGQPIQIITSAEDWSPEFLEKAPYENEVEKNAYLEKYVYDAFDFAQDYPLRVQIIKTGAEELLLVLVVHHIASDGWSASILIDEVWAAYQAIKEGKAPALPALEVQYADYSIWQRKYHGEEAIQRQLEYWKTQLHEVTPLEMPIDYPRPAMQSIRGANKAFQLNKEASEQLLSLAQTYQVTPFMLIMTACKILLYRYSNQKDVCIGTPVAGRTTQATEQLIGCFINTLVIRSQVDPNMSFEQLLLEVKQTTLDAFANQLVPFEQIVETMGAARDMSRSPIYQVSLSYQNIPDVPDAAPDTGIQANDSLSDQMPVTTQRDLSIFAKELPDGLVIAINYCVDLYKDESVDLMLMHFEALLRAIAAQPQQSVASLLMTNPEEEKMMIEQFNDHSLDYPKEATIVGLFNQQVQQTPDNIALSFGDKQWTYQEVDTLSNQLAHHLRDTYQLNKGDFAGIMMNRSEWMIISILGILKTGAAYVPIDPAYPGERKAFMINDTGQKVLLILSENLFDVTTLDIPALAVDIQLEEVASETSSEAITSTATAADAVYVMYTSGTTGQPKGIVVRNQNVIKLAKETKDIAIGAEDRVLQWSNFVFDGSVYEIFSTLLNGAMLRLIQNKDAAQPNELAKVISEHQISVCFFTTSLFHAFVDLELEALKPLRKIVVGGEKMSAVHAKKAIAALGADKVINGYGPTETTVFATTHPIQDFESSSVSIGQPLSNTQIYIVNENNAIAGINVIGEIWIGGDGVSAGYINRPELTAKQFIDNPFGEGKVYKTGDLARILPDGLIEFIGRKDSQIKMRGYRIELGEIENALQATSGVNQAVVIAQKDPSGTQQMVAYIVAQDEFDQDAIRVALKNKLPDYMIPSIMVELEALPLTPNGKVDKKALPVPDLVGMSKVEFVAPRDEMETKLANIWKELLNLEEEVGIHHDFFELGGHSLLATRVISEIRDQLSIELTIRELFEMTTIAQLAQLLAQKEQQNLLPKLVAQERPERVPLSYAQERLWFIDQMEGSLHYHISRVIKIEGDFNEVALERAFQTIVNRHELLRTVIKEEKGVAYQVALPINQWSIQWDLEHDNLNVEQVTALVDKVITRPFDLSQDHPMRVEVIRVHENEHIMVMIMHHIASDGWSFGVFLDEFNALYNAYEKGEELTLDPLPIQYADFSIWQRKYHEGEVLEQQLDFWKEQLQHNVPLSIPTDFPRPATQSFRGATCGIFINRELTDKLNELAGQKEVTPFMLLLTAFKVLLYRYGGQGDLSVGTPIAGRTMKELDPLIGFFVNTLVIRSQAEAETTFDEYLEVIKQTTLDAFANQMAPFEKIVETLGVERDLSRSPVFQVMFAYQNAPAATKKEESSLEVSYTNTSTIVPAQRDLSISIDETPEGLIIGANYCADLYLQSTMERMMEHYLHLLHAILANPNQAIGQLNILGEKEQETLLSFNQLTAEYPKEETIVDLFATQVKLHQDQPALVFEGQTWTYQQVEEASDDLAMRLHAEFNIQTGDFVGILVERSPWMVIGMLGIMKAGAAYVPISIDHPLDRKQFILADTQLQVLLTTDFAQAHCTELDVKTWVMNPKKAAKAVKSVKLPKVDAQTPAYVIYTSGTTGQPKGTLVSHQNLINLVEVHKDLNYQHTDRVLQWPTYTFDISAYDIFNALVHGAALYLIPENVYNDPALLSDFIRKEKINVASIATAFFNTMIDYDVEVFRGMRRLLMGGEKASPAHTKKLAKVIGPDVLINAYGPTEATILTSYFPVQSPDFDRLPIGQPISNVNMYVVNQFEKLAGIGIVGELWIGGDAVSLGYHERPELNAQKFVADPFSTATNARVYKTGDLARYLPDGNIEFIGRIDTQVKVRGYRIELGEIEYALQEHASIRQALVLAKEDHMGIKQLIAYVVADEETFDKEQIQQFLRSKLPAYMAPATYVILEEMPLTIHGKVNQALLPKPDFLSLNKAAYVAPRNELEQQIVDIWMDLLDVEQIGIHDNFFELGGHSLLATRAIAQIKASRAVALNVRDLFQYPTVAQLAGFVETQSDLQQIPELTPQERGEHIPLSFAQERLWFVHQLGGSQQYHTPNILPLRGDINVPFLMQAFKEVLQRHEVLRSLVREHNGQPYQIITSAEDWQVEFLEEAPFATQEEQQAYLEAFVFKAFDFAQDYPIRVQLIKVGTEYLLLMVVHHIASDGWSASILIDEIWAIYQALQAGKQNELPLLEVQYADYAIWQRTHNGEAAIQRQLEYWKTQLNDVSLLELPTDHPRPATQSIRGANKSIRLSQGTTQQLLAMAQSYQTTPFMLIMAACKVLLYRYSNQKDICIGTPIAGRTTKATEQLIGCFINTLVIRSQVEPDMTFEQLLQQIRQTTLDAFANQLVPFEQIVEALGTERDMSRSPIYQISLSYQNMPDSEEMPEEGGSEMDGSEDGGLPVTTQRDLSIFAKEYPNGMMLAMNYCIDLFEEKTIEQMLKHLEVILQSIAQSPEVSIGELEMINQREQAQLLQEFNRTDFDYPSDQNISKLFEQQVEQTPDQIALVLGKQEWSYRQLNEQANHLANYLHAQHEVGKGDFVATLLPRSEWAIVAFLGILKTGAAYVPIDLKYPIDRKQHILTDTQAKVVLTHSDQLMEVVELDATLSPIDTELKAFEQENSTANIDHAEVGGGDLAYVMYTSGSTGQPKGVMVPHRAIARLIFNPDFAFLGASTRIYQYAPLAFDAATFEIWGSLLKGGTLIVPEDELKTVEAITEELQQHQVNTLWLTAGLFHQVVEHHLPLFAGLDYLLSGGDSLQVQAIQKVRSTYPDLVFINGYGPTESTTFATIHRLNAGEQPAPNLNLIGQPIGNTQVYILNPGTDLLTPRGIAGEICIGGDGLADGYLNLPELTKAQFVDHPFKSGERLYRTGDLGKYLPDGKIVFLGRIDTQVKVRGYRIELSEIENIIMQNEAVKQAVVNAIDDANGNKVLVAYFHKEEAVETASIQNQLKTQLPDYMLPTVWVEVESFPLNANGKVDRDQLPLPDLTALSTQEYVAPRNELETSLANIWAELLKQERVGIHDNFFELGGHSLLAMQAISNMQEANNVNINVGDLFRNPTVEMMAKVIEEQANNPIERIQAKDDADNIDQIKLEDDF